MQSVILAIGALADAWALHLLLWRIRLPKAQLKTLLVMFLLFWMMFVAVLWGSGTTTAGILGVLYFSLIHWSAARCYVITCSAMEGDSPTLSLTRHLHRRGEEGISHDEIEECFQQRPFAGA